MSASTQWRGVERPGNGELLVSEVFGPTLQGEGPSAGQAAAFVRLGGCNLRCAWCDTKYTWDSASYDPSAELAVRSTAEVAQEVLTLDVGLVVLTGGEPALQALEAAHLAEIVTSAGPRVEIETNGTVPIGRLADAAALVVASPKLANSEMPLESRLRWGVLEDLAARENAVFKFVVRRAAELTDVQNVVGRLSLDPERVWVMPEATDRATLVRRLAQLAAPVAERGWSLSGRLQVLIWGNERGH